MKFKTAQERFTQAQNDSESVGDTTLQAIAAGLNDLTKDLKSDLAAIKAKLGVIENKLNQRR